MNHLLRTVLVLAIAAVAVAVENRGILVCLAADAAPAIRSAAEGLVADAEHVPLFAAMRRTQGAGAPVLIDSSSFTDERTAWNRAAFNHLVVIGTPGADPLLDKVWGYMVRVDPAARTVFMEGYGTLGGDLGVVESDRNPYLHTRRIDTNDFDTCLVKLSGTSEAGVLAAITAFRSGMVNGLVPVGTPTRPQTSILDLDPSPEAPPALAALPGGALCAGWTQCAGNEYRAFLDAANSEPQRLWRVKWLPPKAWDCIGGKAWLAGIHRMAFANAANLARFADAATASKVAEAIATGARGKKAAAIAGEPAWELEAPTDEVVDPGDVRATLVTSHGAYVIMATLDAAQVAALAAALK